MEWECGTSWAAQEFEELELGDARRTQRLIKLVDDLSAQPTGSIPLACGGWPETKAAYRLLDNPAVEWREILEVHTTRTVERMAGQAVVLCIQDTTQADFTSQSVFRHAQSQSRQIPLPASLRHRRQQPVMHQIHRR